MLDSSQEFGFTEGDQLGLELGLGLGVPLFIFIVIAIVFGRKASKERARRIAGVAPPVFPGQQAYG
jgi:hypothetical protein